MSSRARSFFERHGGLLFVCLVAFVYGGSQLAAQPGFQVGNDSHYHFTMAREIWRGHLVPRVETTLPFTVLTDMPVDHYWGYHLLVAPFGAFDDMVLGMKLATLMFFVAVFASIHLFLRARQVPYAFAWALLTGFFSTQDWRYLMLRGGHFMVPMAFAVAHVAFFVEDAKLRRRLLVLLTYFAMLSYHVAVMLLPMHLACMVALRIIKPSALQRGQIWEPALTAGGIALGLTLNPYMSSTFATWRFAAFHIFFMGRDPARLYDEVAEFHGMPLRLLLANPDFLFLLLAVLAGALFVVVSWRRRRELSTDTVVTMALALFGVLITANALRMREYAVPFAFVFLGVLSRPRHSVPSRPSVAIAAGALALIGFVIHWPQTSAMIGSSLPTHQFDGARSLLEANASHPVLNIAESDYCMMRWQQPDVVAVQGLSRYFLIRNPEVFHDVWELHDRVATSQEVPAILDRFHGRGVRLLAVHYTHPMRRWADLHPLMLKLEFRSSLNGASIYSLDPNGLRAALTP
jgi:hypothetical protein